jgi:hypothetical protein
MSKQQGLKNRNSFQRWIAEMYEKQEPNWTDYFYDGTLSKKKVADEIGFSSDSFKPKRNVKLAGMFELLAKNLTKEGVYQVRKKKLPLDKEVVCDSGSEQEDVRDSAKVRNLRMMNSHLQKENARLLGEVAKLSELREVLMEMGLYK